MVKYKAIMIRFIQITLLILYIFGGINTPVSANVSDKNNNLLNVRITLQRQDYTLNLNERLILKGNIIDALGRPVTNKNIAFEIDHQYVGQAKSDENGDFEWTSAKNSIAGNYVVTVYSKETRILDATSSNVPLTVLPAQIWVQTVPTIPGVTFELNGEQFTTDEGGFASTLVYEAGEYRLDVLVDSYSNPYQRINFDRWLEEEFEPYREISVPANGIIQAGFEVYQLVGQSFIDPNGDLFDTQRIESFSIRSDQGDYFTFKDGSPRWIPAIRVTRRITGLEETRVLYSLLDVTIDGTNVVNKSQQRFYCSPNGNWTISLLLYSLKISAADAISGKPIGESVNVEYPDGKIKNYLLDQNGSLELDLLARGTYYIEMVGTNGLNYNSPVALSRNQDVNLKIISYMDLAIVGIVGLVVAVGLLLYGRPWLVIPEHKKKQLIERRIPQPVSRIAERLNQLKERKPGIAKPGGQVREPKADVPRTYKRLQAPRVILTQSIPQAKTPAIPLHYKDLIRLPNENFVSIVGCSREDFTEMLKVLNARTNKVGRPTKLSAEDQLLATIFVQKAIWNKTELAKFYKISELTLDRYKTKVEIALKESKRHYLLTLTISNDLESYYYRLKNQKKHDQRKKATYEK